MYIKFIKRHSIGIKEGIVAKVNESFGARMLKDGYAEESNEKEFESFKAKNYGVTEVEKPKQKSNKKAKS